MVDPEIFAVAGSVHVPTLPTMDEAIINWGPNADEHGEFTGPMADTNGDPLYEQFTEWVTVVQNSVFLPALVCCYTGGSTNLRCTGLERDWESRPARWSHKKMLGTSHLLAAGCKLLGEPGQQ